MLTPVPSSVAQVLHTSSAPSAFTPTEPQQQSKSSKKRTAVKQVRSKQTEASVLQTSQQTVQLRRNSSSDDLLAADQLARYTSMTADHLVVWHVTANMTAHYFHNVSVIADYLVECRWFYDNILGSIAYRVRRDGLGVFVMCDSIVLWWWNCMVWQKWVCDNDIVV